MIDPELQALKCEAGRRGIPWHDVEAAARWLRAVAIEASEIPNGVRQHAWSMLVGEGSRPFWRFGFEARFGKRVNEGDYTLIPDYDVIYESVAAAYPMYDHEVGQEDLYAFLFSPYKRLPTRLEALREGLELVEHDRRLVVTSNCAGEEF